MDILLIYGSLGIIFTSYVLWFVIPAATGRGGRGCGWALTGQGGTGNMDTVFGYGRYYWVDIHSWVAIVVIILILAHVLLHWDWNIESVKRLKGQIVGMKTAVLERYVTNVLLFIFTVFEVLSGFVIWVVLPRGDGQLFNTLSGIGPTFWGLQRNEWCDLHTWVAVAMLALVIVHVVIHWDWVTKVTLGRVKNNKVQNGTKSKNLEINDMISEFDVCAYQKRVGLLLGLFGAICFIILAFTFQLDHFHRFGFMLYLIPVPFIALLLAHRWPYIGGTILAAVGLAIVAIYAYNPIITVWRIAGVWREPGWGIFSILMVVTIPFVMSAVFYFLSRRKKCLVQG
jgi:hypothetical protein